jgi:hypothetical protein
MRVTVVTRVVPGLACGAQARGQDKPPWEAMRDGSYRELPLWDRRGFLKLSSLASLAVAAGPGQAVEDGKSPLAGLPSAAGKHIQKIKALADNTWLSLGPPAADPKWGKGRGRSWSARMAYAPDLRAAFLFGEGVHAWWNKQNHRYMDDLFVYDIMAHRWICAYPGTDVMNVKLKLDANRFEID